MDSLKKTKIGISIVRSATVGITGVMILGACNSQNGYNSVTVNNTAQVEDFSTKELTLEEKAAIAAKSKYPANAKFYWSSSDVLYDDLKYPDYVYDPDAKRVVSNDTKVFPLESYHIGINQVSTINMYQNDLNPTDEVYETALNRFKEGFSLLYAEMSKPNLGSYTPKSDEYIKILNQYFASNDQSMLTLKNAAMIMNKGMTVDELTFRMKETGNQGVYAFETVLRDDVENVQALYLSGFYNADVKYFNVEVSTYLHDGAVIKDRFTLDLSGGQQSVNN